MASVVLLAGGSPHAHDFDAIGDAWERLLAADGHDINRIGHPDMLVDTLTAGTDVLVMNALFWRMHGDAYDDWRREWAYETTQSVRDALTDFTAAGGGLVANHTATICFDDWSGWLDLVGARWQWGVSSHPALAPCRMKIIGDDHAITAGAPATLDLIDEVYGDLALADGITVLATAQRSAYDNEQPVLFTHRAGGGGGGRAVYAGFGHHPASIEDRHHGRLLQSAVRWAARTAEPSAMSR